MAATSLTDIFVPEIFTPNVIERTSKKIALWQSGVIQNVGNLPIGSGKTITMPFYQDLSGDDSVWDDTTDISLNKITMAEDVAVVLTRERAWGSTDLAAALGQDDPMDAITNLVAYYWARKYQSALMATLAGSIDGFNTLDISGATGAAANIDGASFVSATQVMGDRSGEMTDVVMHSATEAYLRQQDLIDFIPDSEGKTSIATFQGRQVHVDDALAPDSGTYTTYLFGKGSVGFVEESVPTANEAHRHPERNGGTDALYTRRKLSIHPRGVKWVGTAAKSTPSNTELGTAGNFTLVYEPRNVKIVKFKHAVGATNA